MPTHREDMESPRRCSLPSACFTGSRGHYASRHHYRFRLARCLISIVDSAKSQHGREDEGCPDHTHGSRRVVSCPRSNSGSQSTCQCATSMGEAILMVALAVVLGWPPSSRRCRSASLSIETTSPGPPTSWESCLC